MFHLFVMRAYIALDCLWQRLKALLRSKTAEAKLPDCTLTELAHAFLADVKGFFASEENQAIFYEWKNQREQSATDKVAENIENKTNIASRG